MFEDYYAALNGSNQKGDAQPFLSFMLDAIAIASAVAIDQVGDQVTDQVAQLLPAVGDGEFAARELMQAIGQTLVPAT